MPRILTILIILSGIILSQEKQKELFVTIYNNNFGVVRDIREINLNEGNSTISVTDVAQLIDPSSVHINFNGKVLEQNYQYDLVSMNKILQKYIDKKIDLIKEDGTMLSGTLLSAFGQQLVLQKDNGGLEMLPNLEDYRISVGDLPDGLKTKPTLVWDIYSEDSGNEDVEFTYHTGGMNWSAEYVAVLNDDENKIDLNSWVSIDNKSGAAYKNATLKLLAGDVNKVQNNYAPRIAKGMVYEAMDAAQPQISEKELFEYHIYEVNRPVTLSNNEKKQISLFSADEINIDKKYVYSDSYSSKYGRTDKVGVFLEFKNSKENNLGIPFPKGRIKVNKQDGNSVEFIGEDYIDHTPKDENITVKIGEAFDIVVDDKLINSERLSDRVREETRLIKLTNRKDEDISVEIYKSHGGSWKLIKSTSKEEKTDAGTLKFILKVPANKTSELEYTVRYSY